MSDAVTSGLAADERFTWGSLAPESDAAAVRLGESLRELLDAVVLFDPGDGGSDDLLKDIASTVDDLRDRLLTSQREAMPWPDYESMQKGWRPFSPLIGQANPIAPPLFVQEDPEGVKLGERAVVGTATMRAIHEGPPGAVHGGWVASLLDQLLGHANAMSGAGGMTVELTIRYRRKTPYDVPLHLRARCDSVDGRRVRASGEIVADGVVTAEANGLFLMPSPDKVEAMRAMVAGR